MLSSFKLMIMMMMFIIKTFKRYRYSIKTFKRYSIFNKNLGQSTPPCPHSSVVTLSIISSI